MYRTKNGELVGPLKIDQEDMCKVLFDDLLSAVRKLLESVIANKI